jgi:hypothetical protein
VAASEATEGKYGTRAGALTLFRIANEAAPRPAAPDEELRFVATVLTRWLSAFPTVPSVLRPDPGASLSALLDGWCSAVVHALAARPRTIAEAAGAAGVELGEDATEELIEAMERAGLVAVREDCDEEERFAVTEWLRLAVGPLAAAAWMELRHPPGDTAAIAPLDVSASFLLAVPLVTLPEELSASCRLIVPVPGRPPELAGVMVLVEQGDVTSVSADLTMTSDTFATGSPGQWLDSLIDPGAATVEPHGNLQLPLGLIEGLHESLFGNSQTKTD